MKILLIVVGVLVLALFVFGSQFVSVRNQIAVDSVAIDAAWANVDIALQRRADLIPNLVETVKGFASQEKTVIEAVANARAALGGARTPAEKMAANTQLDGPSEAREKPAKAANSVAGFAGSKTNAFSSRFSTDRPRDSRCQLPPPSVLRKTPWPEIPT